MELSASLRFHITLARVAHGTAEFRFLNSSKPIIIGEGPDIDHFAEHQKLQSKLFDSPSGGTPLCRHIREVLCEIKAIEPTLRSQGLKVCLVIATDGESTDGDVMDAMRPLVGLPVWVVIRLCTSDDRVVKYWNRIDSELELDLDVLDDLRSEAAEVRYLPVNNLYLFQLLL